MSEGGEESRPTKRRGVVGWVIDNPVAANLLMLVLLVGGALSLPRIQQEVFPEAILDIVTVTVPYPGATPAEVEEGIVLAVEEAIRGIEGIKEIRSSSTEGQARVSAELSRGTNINQARNDIESAVNRITSFPQDAEEPIISTPTNRRQVLSLIIYGDVSKHTLRMLSEEARRDLLRDERVAQIEIEGLPPPEISIEVEQAVLRELDLTRSQLARLIDQASVELPAGSIETPAGEFLLRIMERRDEGDEFEDIAVIARPDGTRVTLQEIATVVDGFRETKQEALFNGQPAVQLKIFRTNDRTPIETSNAVDEYIERMRPQWPSTINLKVWNDASIIYNDRIQLLVENGRLGFILVLAILGLFLQPRLAFWVTIGLPVSFLGVFLFMPMLGVSINMLTLFAFILVLGIVVDDAIVVGEASFLHMQEGDAPQDAALKGAREVMVPVVFAVITTIVAFVPMLFVPGVTGDFFRVIPLVVIPILVLSLVESFLVLPAHLAHINTENRQRWLKRVTKWQQSFSDWFKRMVERYYRPFIRRVISWRYLALAISFGVLLVAIGYVTGGRIAFRFLPEIESDLVTASIELPTGAPIEETRRIAEIVTQAMRDLQEDAFESDPVEGVFTSIGSQQAAEDDPTGGALRAASNLAAVSISLISAGERQVSAAEITRMWREEIGDIAGIDKLSFTYRAGPGAGADINYELAHEDLDILQAAASDLADALRGYDGVSEVDDGFDEGKPQIELRLKPAARALGITELELARQVRGAYFGEEAVRTQRGKDELRVYVRRAESDREQLSDLFGKVIITEEGGEIPLEEAAYIDYSRSYTVIEREQGQRATEITASVDRSKTSANEVTADLQSRTLPELRSRYQGLAFEFSGPQQDRQEALAALGNGMMIALLVMYGLLAVIFRSYGQPLLVLIAIPFGFVGALLGHLIMGFDLSLVSMFGLVALAGVVVNDSLVLIATINSRRDGDERIEDLVTEGAMRRFRPVLLTSLTTFFGLAPMIFETSLQARFLIPMALSLGFGVLFVTVIALVIVPSLYCVFEDMKGLLKRR